MKPSSARGRDRKYSCIKCGTYVYSPEKPSCPNCNGRMGRQRKRDMKFKIKYFNNKESIKS